MLALTPNTSFDQSIPFDHVHATRAHNACIRMLNDSDVYSIVVVGSALFMDGPSTSYNMKHKLDTCLKEVVKLGKTKMVIFNGANFSGNEEGTTFTSSHWIQNAHNIYANHPTYKHISFHCIALAPYSTQTMKATWMEEYGNNRTQTYIVAFQAQERQEIIANIGVYAHKVIINEGAVGTLHEVYSMYKTSPNMFDNIHGRVRVNNISYLIGTVVMNTINNPHPYNQFVFKALIRSLNTLYDMPHNSL